MNRLAEPPGPAALSALACRLLGSGSATGVRSLTGGIMCSVHAADLESASGECLPVVIKRYTQEFLDLEPRSYKRERHALDLLTRSAAPAPRLLLADDTGSIFGTPTIVMSRLPGTSLMMQTRDFPAGDTHWLIRVAEVLAQVHSTPMAPHELSLLPPYGPREVGAKWFFGLEPPERDRHRRALTQGDAMHDVLSRAWSPIPVEPQVLVHGDFHPGNILWDGGAVTGVVDWSESYAGAREVDLAHMRWEIALRFDLGAADTFLAAYESAAGRRVPHMPLWDLMLVWRLALVLDSWVWFFELEGRTDGSRANLEARRDAFAAHALGSCTKSPNIRT